MKSKRVAALEPKIVAMARVGTSTKAIAKRLGCSTTHVNRVRGAHGLALPRAGAQPVHDEAIAELTARGLSASQIAAKLGVTLRTVTRSRVRQGIAKSPGRRLTDDEIARAMVLLEDGASVTEVERTLGRTPGSLHRRFRQWTWSPEQVREYATLRAREVRRERRVNA